MDPARRNTSHWPGASERRNGDAGANDEKGGRGTLGFKMIREVRRVVVRPPKILLNAKVGEGIMWEVTKALYGLRALLADWGHWG